LRTPAFCPITKDDFAALCGFSQLPLAAAVGKLPALTVPDAAILPAPSAAGFRLEN
jgi:hypothetical protein